jgi:iron complex transport system substrate-binding protein
MRSVSPFSVLLCFILSCVLLSCIQTDPANAPIVTLVDSEGTAVMLESHPQRIISLGPSNTEILYALGAEQRVLGVDDYSDYPPEVQVKPKLGAPFPSFNMESIVALDPDLVVSVPLVQFNDQMRSHGIPVVVLDPRDLEEILATILLLGDAIGAKDEALTLVSNLQHRIEAVRVGIKGSQKVRVFYELDATDSTRPYTVGPGSFVGDLITLAGGWNVSSQTAAAYPQVGLEFVVAMDPQVILLGDAFAPYNPQTPEMVRRRPGWGIITAVQEGAIIPIDGDLTTRPGPRIVDGLEAIAEALHPGWSSD